MSRPIDADELTNNKPEFMNEKVVRDTKYQTTRDRIYAKAWNACNSYWLDTINNAPTVELDDSIIQDVLNKRCMTVVTNKHLRALYDKRPPHGEWIKGQEISRTMIGSKVQHIDYKNYTCSNCGLRLDYLLYHFDGSPFYKFCPECGAEMRGGAQ